MVGRVQLAVLPGDGQNVANDVKVSAIILAKRPQAGGVAEVKEVVESWCGAGTIKRLFLRAGAEHRLGGRVGKVPSPRPFRHAVGALLQGELVLVVRRVHRQRQFELMEVIHALHTHRAFLRPREGWQKHGGQDGDDGNHDEQFDQGKASQALTPGKPAVGRVISAHTGKGKPRGQPPACRRAAGPNEKRFRIRFQVWV